MSNKKDEKPKAIYEPGELDRTRKNLGKISPQEAMRVADKLGGEIGVEKSLTFSNTLEKRKKRYVKRVVHSEKNNQTQETSSRKSEKKERIQHTQFKTQKKAPSSILPIMRPHARKLLDSIMMSPEYRIKLNYGIFTFVVNAMQGNQEKVSPQFIIYSLQQYFLSMQKFHIAIKNMINYSTKDFNIALSENKSNYYRAIFFISEWDIQGLHEHYKTLEQNSKNITIGKLIPFTKALFHLIIPIYYLGETTIISFLKQMYTENAPFLKDSKEAFMNYTKEAASRWIYINGQVVKGMYPILLRMTSKEFFDYPSFYFKQTAQILQFLNLSKFDILLPEIQKSESAQEIKNINKEEKIEEKETKEEKTQENEANPQDEVDAVLIAKGIELLEDLFPQAGWDRLESLPDLYPYFQPIYSFADGFNLLDSTNPMQVTIILHRILEDFFQALRNIKYSIDKEPEFSLRGDSINAVFSEWSSYREYQFEKIYLPELKEYVNQAYTQSEFVKSTYAKKLMSNFFWQTKYHFLPYLNFELIFMEKPDKDSTISPLPNRISYLKQIYKTLVNRVEQNKADASDYQKRNDDLYGAQGLYLPYRFDIPNPVSKRVDILLNKKKGKNATNINLIKHTLCILSVFDWWVNNKESPANKRTERIPYRISPEDGSPIFYVNKKTDVDRLFIQHIKAKVTQKPS